MAEPRHGLSARQTEVILLVGKGLTSKEIKVIDEVQSRVNALLVKQARAYSDLKMMELTNSDGSLKPIKLRSLEGSED